MITGSDLKLWGLPEGPLYKTAIKAFNHPTCNLGKAKMEVLVKTMLTDPQSLVGHAVIAPLVKEYMERQKADQPKTALLLNANHCPLTVFGENMIEMGAMSQIYMAAKLPVSVRAALMPDAHEGYGLPIGGVLAVDNAVIPYAVGVDIGCRMKMTVLDIPGKQARGMVDKLGNVLTACTIFGAGVEQTAKVEHPVLDDERFDIAFIKKACLRNIAVKQLGTSGGGNHFVEFGVVEVEGFDEPMLAVLSHSGSRGMGNKIGLHYSDLAIQKTKLQNDAKRLAWLDLDSAEGQEYWEAMNLAGDYSRACHDIIHGRICKEMSVKGLKVFENHHNFAWKEVVDGKNVIVHRKGATPAGVDDIGVIPGSMTTPTFVVRGKGDVRSMSSSSHGAGRMMSRMKAKESFTMSAMKKNLEDAGVTLLGGGLDECSMAYKDIEQVMAFQSDLVNIIGRFKPMVVRMANEQLKPWEKE